MTAEGTPFDTVLEGRRSYEIGLAAGITDAYPHLRHLVSSRTLTESPDPAAELVADDPVATVRELKRLSTLRAAPRGLPSRRQFSCPTRRDCRMDAYARGRG